MSLPQTVFKAPFDQFVKDQIELREQVYARGRAELRDMQDITYLNSRTGWVRLMSCVDILDIDKQLIPKEDLKSNPGKYNLKSVINDVESSIRDQAQGSKQELAYKYILSNGVQPINGAAARDGLSFDSTNFDDKGKFKHWTNNSYGLGSSVQGIKPMPGITSADIRDFNNGALREATIKIQAWDIEQLQIIELLYMRLGFTMYLEWGHTIYASGKPTAFDEQENTWKIKTIDQDENPSLRDIIFPQPPNKQLSFNAILEKIQQQREKFEGNYDGFLGRVTNFNWSYNQANESYTIELKLITVGSVIESLNMNTGFDKTSAELETPFTGSLEERYYYEGQKTNLGNFLWLGRMSSSPAARRNLEGDGSVPLLLRAFVFLQTGVDIGGETAPQTEVQYPTPLTFTGVVDGYGKCITLEQITTSSIFGTNHFLDFNKKVSSFDTNRVPKTFVTIPHIYQKNLNQPQNSDDMDKYTDELITYIRFGDLLQWLEKHNNETTNAEGEEDLIVKIHYDEDSTINKMYTFTPYLFSADPSICVINNEFDVNVTATNTGFFGTYRYYVVCDHFYVNPYFHTDTNYGHTMNIYLNIAFLMECINSSVNEYENGMVSVFDFLTKVCNGINESLGHVCHLFPWLDAETGTLYIINEYDNTDSLKDNSIELSKLQTSGYVGQRAPAGISEDQPRLRNEVGTIKDIKLTTGLSKDVQNTIAIGAAAQGVSLGQEAVSFLSWHKGLKDRVIPQLAQSRGADENTKEETRLEREKDRLERLVDNMSQLAYTMATINQCWPQGTTNLQDPPQGYAGKLYHVFDKELFNQAKTLLKDYIHISSAYIAKQQGKATPYNGFLPLNFSLTMDGLSGMKIFQRFFLNARMVPVRYPILFDTVIKGINHTIQGNTWNTTIETFAVYQSIMNTTSYKGVFGNPYYIILKDKDPKIQVNIQLHGPLASATTTALVLDPNPKPTPAQVLANLQTILNELKRQGFTREEAIGIAGNIYRETGGTYSPTIVERNISKTNAYGLFQFTPFTIFKTNARDTEYINASQTYKFTETYTPGVSFTTAGEKPFNTHTPIYVLFNATRYKVGGQYAYNTIKGQIQFFKDLLNEQLATYVGNQFVYSNDPSLKGLWKKIQRKAAAVSGANKQLYALGIADYFTEYYERPEYMELSKKVARTGVSMILKDLEQGRLTW